MFKILVIMLISFNLYASSTMGTSGGEGRNKSHVKMHKGEIQNVLKAGTYTYVEVKGKKATLWAATSRKDVKKGMKVEFSKDMPMKNFKSKSLKRTFKTVYFVSDLFDEGKASSYKKSSTGVKAATKNRGTYRRKIKVGSIKKADFTVLDVWNKRTTLSGKEISLRAKVVKVTPQVMKKNWIHVQDGTGTDKFYDLVLTTDQNAKVGDIILIKGKVTTNKDFGFGYFYKLLIENVKF